MTSTPLGRQGIIMGVLGARLRPDGDPQDGQRDGQRGGAPAGASMTDRSPDAAEVGASSTEPADAQP